MKEKIAYEPGALDAVRYEKTVRIQTHENVSLEYEIAGIGSRYIAGWLDSLFRGAFYVVVLIAGLLVSDLRNLLSEGVSEISASFESYYYLFIACYLALYLIRILYHLITELVSGGSGPAKKIVGIRVVQVTGEAPTAAQLLIRNLLRLIDVIPGGSIIDGFIALYNPQGRRCGDLAAGTMVIKYRRESSTEEFLNAALSYEPDTDAAAYENKNIEELLSDSDGAEAGLAAEEAFRREMLEALAKNRDENPVQEPVSSQTSADTAAEKTEIPDGFIPASAAADPGYEIAPFMTEEETLILRDYMKNRKLFINSKMYDERFARLISLRRSYDKTEGFTEKEAQDIIRQALVYLDRCYPELENGAKL